MFGFFNKAAKNPAAPDEAERERLFREIRKLGAVPGVMRDGTVMATGTIDLSGKPLAKLPDLSGVTVWGDFLCNGCHLSSLKGAPAKVTGRFDCSKNGLFVISFGPKEVGGEYNCSGNLLLSLKGAPPEVSTFDCSNNAMKTLEGGPKKVTSTFICVNTGILSLEHGPREVAGDIVVTKSPLKDLRHAPEKFGHMITDFGDFSSPSDIPAELGGPQPPAPEPAPQEAPEPVLAVNGPIVVHRPLSLVKKR